MPTKYRYIVRETRLHQCSDLRNKCISGRHQHHLLWLAREIEHAEPRGNKSSDWLLLLDPPGSFYLAVTSLGGTWTTHYWAWIIEGRFWEPIEYFGGQWEVLLSQDAKPWKRIPNQDEQAWPLTTRSTWLRRKGLGRHILELKFF